MQNIHNYKLIYDSNYSTFNASLSLIDSFFSWINYGPSIVDNLPIIVDFPPFFNSDVCSFFSGCTGFYFDPNVTQFANSELALQVFYCESGFWKSFLNAFPGEKFPLNAYEKEALVNFIVPASWQDMDNIYHEIFLEVSLNIGANDTFDMNYFNDEKYSTIFDYNKLLKLKLDFIKNNTTS